MGSQYPPQPYYGHPPPTVYYQPHPDPKAKRPGSSGCLRCICCCCNCLVCLILASFAVSIFILVYYEPERPVYELKDFQVKKFDIKGNILETDIAVSVQATNTNTKIELRYAKDNSIDVGYWDMKICSGSFPSFVQQTKNTTMVHASLGGKTEVSQSFQDSIDKDQMEGRIPLDVEIEVSTIFVIEGINWSKMETKMKCILVVDSLKSDKKTKIFYKKCGIKLEMT
ncbi:hypothetical protein F3Y22_tig00112206pilonHSYRG00307 [Hibiscus syriacus]|uniref:Late embryogenesis abundant protein LEA-2 subgroup domain-containing protein n=1 Tax=Hibiscus syriacus TaxID=106335 RepID=A0A6A2YBS8_HIBSY|nr:NDR1/HIN1-like protein 13 [Hibiscus syriacus]KAE8670127.1 hypothetical protein F3Y22_tig00112206pilonHSYRG00307 [Hibiscus syriacus]